MRWEEVQGEGEVGGGEDGERLDEDVGDGFVFGEVGVELISAQTDSVSILQAVCVVSYILEERMCLFR